MQMQTVPLSRLAQEDIIDAIGHEWMLVTAGTPDNYNMLTASWGGVGYLWNRPVAFVFIRPERLTHDFIERNERLTLSFLGRDAAMRNAYQLIGTRSGRELDKAAATGLTPIATPAGNVTFAQARLTLEGRKLFQTDMQPENFLEPRLLEQWYSAAKGGLHTIYIIELENIYE